jgi:glycosyltransferase involved in cell wall biosynthesis
LLLKIDCRVPAANPLREIAALLPEPSPPVGVLYNQPLSTGRLVELYQGADCFVLPTRGEGWGMPILKAMACGLPVVATNWSAPTTFLTGENSYPLPVRALVPADEHSRYTRGARWAEPDQDALTDMLRAVAADPAGRKQRGERAARDARQWTWARGLDTIEARLAAIG